MLIASVVQWGRKHPFGIKIGVLWDCRFAICHFGRVILANHRTILSLAISRGAFLEAPAMSLALLASFFCECKRSRFNLASEVLKTGLRLMFRRV